MGKVCFLIYFSVLTKILTSRTQGLQLNIFYYDTIIE